MNVDLSGKLGGCFKIIAMFVSSMHIHQAANIFSILFQIYQTTDIVTHGLNNE